jgi:peptide/nickel transport system substrate-binding protein
VSGLFSIKKHLFSLPIATLLAAAAPCGTAIIPNGIGLGDPVPPTGLNPLLASGDQNKLQYAILLYRPLVWVGKNIEFDPERSLAASIESMDGNTRFRVTLKPWRWSDGTLITPDDVKFGWERILLLNQPGHAYYSAAGQGGIPDRVRGVLPDGANAVVITLKAAANPDWFILNGLSLIYPLPRHAWGDISADDMKLRELDASLYKVTDGPFRLVDLQPRRQVIYASNPLYGGHPAALQKLLVVSPDTGAAALRAAEAGESDMARVPYASWQQLQGRAGFHFFKFPEPYGYAALMFNQNSAAAPFLRDQVVRVALARAADQPEMIKLAYKGMGNETHAPAPSQPSAWRSPAVRAGTVSLRHDIRAARAALDAAGWQPGEDGVRQRRGVRLAFTVLTDADPDSPELQMLQVLQQNLRDAGAAMSLQLKPYAQLLALLGDGGTQWSAALIAITTPAVPDGIGYWNTGEGGNWGINVGHFSDPRMDQLIRASTTQPGPDRLYDYQDYAAAQQPALFLPQAQQLLMAAARLRGVEEFYHAMGLWSPEYLSVDDPVCHVPSHGAALH